MKRAQLTKQLIGETLKHLAESTPLDKISVQNILDAAGISRKTFYRHFRDKQELVVWIFRTELGQAIRDTCPPSHIEDNTLSRETNYADLPYYPNLFGADPEAVFSRYVTNLLKVLYTHRAFYANVFSSASQNSMRLYFYQLTYAHLLNDVNLLVGKQPVTEEEKEIVANYFTSAHVGAILQWIEHGMKPSPSSQSVPFVSAITPMCVEHVINYLIDKHARPGKSAGKHTGYLQGNFKLGK